MERERKFQWGGIILAGMVLVCLLIFGLSMMQERNRVQEDLTGKEATLALAKEKLSDTGAALDAALTENAHYQQAQQDQARVMSEMEEQLQQVQGQLLQAIGERDVAAESLADVTEELNMARAALNTAVQERDEARGALAAMTQERDVALISLAGVAAEKEDAQGKLDAAAAGQNDALEQITALTKEADELKTEIGAVTMERDNARAQVKKLTDENSELQSTIDSMKRGQDGLSQQLETVTDEKEALAGQLETVTGEKDTLVSQLETVTGEKEALAGQLETVMGEKNGLAEQMDLILDDKMGLERELNAVKGERDSLVIQLGEMTQQRDSFESQLASVTEAFGAAMQEQTQPFSVPIGTWVMEPYTFRVPAFWMMQQDEAGNLHFYYDQAGCVLSCVHEKNDGYLDVNGIVQLYEQRALQMASSLQATENQLQKEWHTLAGGPCLITRYDVQGMTMYQLQYCHDGVNTLVATYTDRMNNAGQASQVMTELLDSLSYLPDAM